MARFLAHAWPGNVRELENVVERVIALSRSGVADATTLGWDNLPSAAPMLIGAKDRFPLYDDYMLQREQEIVGWALEQCNNNISEAARLLKIPRTTLTSKLPRLFPSLEQRGDPAPSVLAPEQ